MLWAGGVKKAGSVDRMKVIEALETGISIKAPSGKVTIDPPTHHCVLDVHIAEVKDKKLNVLEDFAQQKPADTAAVCDLIKNPTDNQQYVIKILNAASAARILRLRKGERGSRCSPGDPGPLRDRQPGADQRRAGDHLRHDAGDQSRPWRVPDARRLCRDRRDQPWRQHLDRDAGGGAGRGRPDRRRRRADDHPLSLRPHDRHHAGDLGPQPVPGRADDGDLRQHHGRHLGAARQFRDRRLPHQRLHAVRHRGRGGGAGRDLRRAALDPARADRARHDAERRHGGGARRQPAARLCRHLRPRRRAVGAGRRRAGAGLRRLPDHRGRLCRQILHHGDRRRRGDPHRHGHRIRAVRRHQPDRHLSSRRRCSAKSRCWPPPSC